MEIEETKRREVHIWKLMKSDNRLIGNTRYFHERRRSNKINNFDFNFDNKQRYFESVEYTYAYLTNAVLSFHICDNFIHFPFKLL